MRILKIRLKNLNSLAGSWEFDLTGDAYTADGIFAITGPTGGGKTTILDAMCLALYGCTPRLKTISQSTNEIMHRQSAECSAEVEIATSGGIYRCTWAQDRAYGKPDGALQPSRHEIADARTGKILTTRKREVAKLVEELTGMDYDRFTRSVMLAQGDFAAFLNASPDDRSPLLEQITGTEVYSRISMAVHQRRRDEQEKLKVLEAEGSGITLLPDEEMVALREEEATLIQQTDSLQELIRLSRTGITWHQERTRIARVISETEREQADWAEERAVAEEPLKRLQRGETAATLEGDYRRVTTLREGEEKDKTSLTRLEAALPAKKEMALEAEASVQIQEKALRDAQEQAELAAPILRTVRALDLQMGVAEDRLRELRRETEKADRDWETARKELLEAAKAGDMTLASAENAIWFLNEHDITGDPTAVSGTLTTIAALVTDAIPGDTSRPIHPEAAQISADAEKKVDSLEKALTGVIWYADPETLRTKTAVSQDQITQLNMLLERLRDGADDERQSAELTKRIHDKTEEGTRNRTAQEACTRERETQERLADQMEETVRLAARVRDLEDERSYLKTGEPCPLCGAIDHPYVQDIATLPRAADEDLKRERAAVIALRNKENTLLVTVARCESDVKAAKEALATIREREEYRENAWKEGCRIWALDPNAKDREEAVHAALRTADQTIKLYDRAEKAIRVLKEQIQAIHTLIRCCHQAIERFGVAESYALRRALQQTDLQKLREERKNLFGEASPDETEHQFARTIRGKQGVCKAAEEHHRKLVQEYAGLEGEAKTLRTAIQTQGEERKEAEERFEETVFNAGFFGEEDFVAALLTPDKAKALRDIRDNLERWQAGLAARHATALKEAEAHRSSASPAKDEDTLTKDLQKHTKAEQEANTRRGEIRQQLRRQEEEEARYAGQQAKILLQQTETARWSELHALIGSADGKKFRNFAQGLTFAVMIASANRQLQAMTDRYLLIQSPELPLELAVTDNYQGGTIRSTRNLSGGESFLVSLALALGLASMASGKIKVDSLFLDEGFGTLDADALEMALSTLSSLRNQGKIIGVISHVPALNERIGTVIKIKKESGGRSTANGPGVTRRRA